MSAPGGRTLPAFDVYAELGLSRDASPDQVRGAYRRKAKEHHPDVATDASAAEARMKRINQARDVLLDPARRVEYDRLRASSGAHGQTHASRRPAASTASSGRARSADTAANTTAAQADRDRRAHAARERSARVRADQDRWEREAEARAARDVAARAERRRREREGAAHAEPRREPRTAPRAAPQPPRTPTGKPAGPNSGVGIDLLARFGSHVTVEIRVLGDEVIRRWAASLGKKRG